MYLLMLMKIGSNYLITSTLVGPGTISLSPAYSKILAFSWIAAIKVYMIQGTFVNL